MKVKGTVLTWNGGVGTARLDHSRRVSTIFWPDLQYPAIIKDYFKILYEGEIVTIRHQSDGKVVTLDSLETFARLQKNIKFAVRKRGWESLTKSDLKIWLMMEKLQEAHNAIHINRINDLENFSNKKGSRQPLSHFVQEAISPAMVALGTNREVIEILDASFDMPIDRLRTVAEKYSSLKLTFGTLLVMSTMFEFGKLEEDAHVLRHVMAFLKHHNLKEQNLITPEELTSTV